jgi:hypothetical protein
MLPITHHLSDPLTNLYELTIRLIPSMRRCGAKMHPWTEMKQAGGMGALRNFARVEVLL